MRGSRQAMMASLLGFASDGGFYQDVEALLRPRSQAPNGRGRITGIAKARRAARKRRAIRARMPKGRG